MSKNIAIIPARGGSKRIPKKNIIEFFSKPIISYTIEAALNSGLFERVVVSTDDQEIADISRQCGADVPFLRDKYTDDHSSVSLGTIRTLEQFEERMGETYDVVVQLMANCPLRKSEHIIDAYNNFFQHKSFFQLSCSKYGWLNPWWAYSLDNTLKPSACFPNHNRKRSQDLEDLYCPTGAIWIADVPQLKECGNFYGPDHIFYPLDWKAAVDIDNYEDLDFAKAVYSMEMNKKNEDR